MRRILVTGGAGFIGSHLCKRLLESGSSVHCIDDLSLGRERFIAPLRENKRFHFSHFDLAASVSELRQLLAGPAFTEVWHLAANSDIQNGLKDRGVDLSRTFLTTFNLLEALTDAPPASFVFASSSAVLGEASVSLAEDFGPSRPISFYGAAKLASEGYLSAFSHLRGWRSFVFRFPNVVGPHATHGVILDFVDRIRQTKRLDVLGNGHQTKPYLHVDDLVEGMVKATSTPTDETMSIFHLAGKGLTSVREIAEWTAAELGLPTERIAYGTADRGWPGDVPRFEYDCSKIEALGWQPRLDSSAAVRLAIKQIAAERG